MVKEPLKMKKKDQISFDEQEAKRLQAEFDEQDRLVEEKARQIEDENLAYDHVQAMMDADYELVARCTGRVNRGGLVLAGKVVKLLLGLVKVHGFGSLGP
nr:hypothetical protein [Tanacetum cinerariifolium]